LSFIAVIVSLWLISFREPRQHVHHLHPFRAIAEGVVYAFRRKDIRLFMAASAITSIFGWSYVSILPVIIEEVFHRDAAALGYFFSAIGLGALTAVVLVSLYLDRAGVRRFVIGGSALFGCSLSALAYVKSYELALLFAACSGLAIISQFSVINTTLQRSVPDAIRGRVMSIAVLMFRGTVPIGSFIMGSLAESLGTQRALAIGAGMVLATASLLFMQRRDMPESESERYS
jgi:predicted MFS family arabinose efflux permease